MWLEKIKDQSLKKKEADVLIVSASSDEGLTLATLASLSLGCLESRLVTRIPGEKVPLQALAGLYIDYQQF